MHLTTGQLLDLRDGSPPPGVAGHVAACPACRTELERLRRVRDALRALPPVAAPPLRRRGRVARAAGLALAASVVMAIALLLLQPAPPAGPAGGDEVAGLIAQSRALERMVADFDTDAGVVDLQTAATIIAIEDRIATLDAHVRRAALTEQPVPVELWRQRVDLVQALVGVHAAAASRSF